MFSYFFLWAKKISKGGRGPIPLNTPLQSDTINVHSVSCLMFDIIEQKMFSCKTVDPDCPYNIQTNLAIWAPKQNVQWLIVGSFVRSLVRLFVRSFVGTFVGWFVRPLVCSLVHCHWVCH